MPDKTPNGSSNGWGGEVYTVSRFSTLPPEQQDHVHEFRNNVQLRTPAPAALHSQLASLESPHDQTDASYTASRERGMIESLNDARQVTRRTSLRFRKPSDMDVPPPCIKCGGTTAQEMIHLEDRLKQGHSEMQNILVLELC